MSQGANGVDLISQSPVQSPDLLMPGRPFMVNGLDWSWAFVIFREIPGFSGYWIGTNASLWSFRDNSGKAKSNCRRLKPGSCKYGHLKKMLTDDHGHRRTCYVHSVMLQVFRGKRPDGAVCRHRDGNPTNNKLSNLEWGTVLDNIHDRDRIHKTTAKGEAYPHVKLKNDDIGIIYDLFESGWLIKDIASRFRIDASECSKILRGIYWSHAVPGRQPPLLNRSGRQSGSRHWSQLNPEKAARGERHPNARLTQENAREIRDLRARFGMTHQELSLKFGVGHCTIGRVLHGLSYQES